VPESPRVHVFEHGDRDWWAECLICNTWVSASNASQCDAEQKFGRHLQNDHVATSEDNDLAVARILLDTWDVLGVRELDVDPEHEYLHESARLLTLLGKEVSRSKLLAHLASERHNLTAVADERADRFAADALLEWWTSRR
jgi:hypothetical protein